VIIGVGAPRGITPRRAFVAQAHGSQNLAGG
jgi:hypothetical protein